MTKYELAYYYIPSLMRKCPFDDIPELISLDRDFGIFMKDEIDSEFSWDELHFENRNLTEQHSVIMITFPEPTDVPDAKYGLLFFERTHQTMSYYTLELTFPMDEEAEAWVVGSKSSDGKIHFNYGHFKGEATREIFLDYCFNYLILDHPEFGS